MPTTVDSHGRVTVPKTIRDYLGLRTTERLVELRRQRRIRYEDVARMRCVLANAKPFIITSDYHPQQAEVTSQMLYQQLRDRPMPQQMGLWG